MQPIHLRVSLLATIVPNEKRVPQVNGLCFVEQFSIYLLDLARLADDLASLAREKRQSAFERALSVTDKCNISATTTVRAANVKGNVAPLLLFFAQL